MILLKAFLLAIAANLASGRVWSPITWPFCYPLINGTVVGLILGDPLLGLMAGATINLAYIGWISAGGTMPSNIGIAGVYGTAITILAKATPELAITLAIPIGLLGVLQWNLQMTLNVFWVHRLDANAEKGEINKIFFNAWLFPQLTALVINGTPAFILMLLGGDFFNSVLNQIPQDFVNALSVTGNLLPALGVAMLLNYLGKKKMIPYFVIGFFAATFLGLSIMAVAILGACIAVIVYYGGMSKEEELFGAGEEEETKTELKIRLRRSDMIKHWLIGLGAEVGYNYERMQASGNVLAMLPIIRRLYTDPEDIKAALKRYLVFFNTEPSFVGNIIPGICASLEEERANGADISDEMINGLRTGLMGPLAGVGDSLAGGIIYPIAVSVGCALALKGNFTGPILFFAVFTGIMLVLGYNLYQMGYKQGSRSVMNILGEGAGSITRMTDAFGILGLLVIGAMGAEKVLVYVPLQISIGQTTVIFQDVLNGLLPNLLPFGFIIGTWGLLKKKVSPIVVVLILMVIGIVGYYTGILGLGV
ncbi:PTS system mannose/fructose/sorbose family transporter subunit IID [Lacrimispora sp. 210928-DFI.3.58]|uniref:PTS system mannose/fructose/sorbose family transporter subunit IID n=1 Tax=Lacrimispora sp. 210928-DFI.3.58 TaxID=2883214 RepID=UPI001D084254|nr:PTS system mannose/fructose/sorbose family transporter subunit IID [Lacrimispora sp. 210928-DFI.3.58]MCB7317754.1 PTS system mannose/fructose/sorbose family transporter subunit IID [Lacrimispora sp. 210928-DFI.3.58]